MHAAASAYLQDGATKRLLLFDLKISNNEKNYFGFRYSSFFSYGAVAPNYNAGLLHINGAVYDASAGSGSILAANSTLLIGGGGTWVLNNAMLTTPRISNSQTEVIEFNSGNYIRNTVNVRLSKKYKK